jgi:site-specific recombinase XerD
MALSIEKVIHNLHFDRLFLDRIDEVERAKKKTLHANGIPFHYIAVFKTLLCMKEADMTPEEVAKSFESLFGRHIKQSSLSRTLSYLRSTLKLIAKNDNAFADDRFRYVKLTAAGREFQKHLIGSTTVSQEYAPEMREVINIAGRRQTI